MLERDTYMFWIKSEALQDSIILQENKEKRFCKPMTCMWHDNKFSLVEKRVKFIEIIS